MRAAGIGWLIGHALALFILGDVLGAALIGVGLLMICAGRTREAA